MGDRHDGFGAAEARDERPPPADPFDSRRHGGREASSRKNKRMWR
jgi:hypothetical protein